MIKKDTKIYCPNCKEHVLTALRDIQKGDPMYSIDWSSPRINLVFGQKIQCDLCEQSLIDEINSKV